MSDKPRSIDQHRRFFGLVRAVFHHWPETEKFQPDNEEHLRAYLLVKAGHRSVKEFYACDKEASEDFARLIPVVAALMLNRYCWSWVEGDAIRVCAPLTTKFEGPDKMDHATACKVYDAVDEYLRSIGIDPDQMLAEHEAAA